MSDSYKTQSQHLQPDVFWVSYIMFLYIYVLTGNPHNFKTTTMLSATSVLPTIEVYLYDQNSKSKGSKFLDSIFQHLVALKYSLYSIFRL
jgi:hypothetical protein